MRSVQICKKASFYAVWIIKVTCKPQSKLRSHFGEPTKPESDAARTENGISRLVWASAEGQMQQRREYENTRMLVAENECKGRERSGGATI